jgi:ferredoxin, 2Fe-2S
MPTIVFLLPDGTERAVSAPAGTSVMLAAVNHNVRGIDGECGGCLSCATCHVWVEDPGPGLLPPPADEELGMLDFVAAERRSGSRLSCQIEITPQIDGLRVQVPDTQV